jgi:hypothetical protein
LDESFWKEQNQTSVVGPCAKAQAQSCQAKGLDGLGMSSEQDKGFESWRSNSPASIPGMDASCLADAEHCQYI